MSKKRIIKETFDDGTVQYRVEVFLKPLFFWKGYWVTDTCSDPFGYGVTLEAVFDTLEEAEEYTSKVACGEYGVEVTEAYIAGVLSERNRGTEWSDDDKTRLKVIKEELERFIMFNQYGTPLSVDDIGWLETLPERFNLQPKGEWNEEDEKIIEGMIVDYKGEIEHLSDSTIDEQAKSVYQGRIDFLNRLKAYCPESYDNDVQNKIEDAIYLIEHYASHGHDKNLKEKVISGLKSLRPQPKQEWSDEDKEMLMKVEQIVLKHWNSLSDSFYHKYDDETQDAESCYNWLKSLTLNLKKKNEDVAKLCSNEWSEEDEKHIEALILASDRCMGKWHCCNEQCEISEHLDWLKSLRPLQYCENCKLKRSVENWKPSEEQIGTLKRWLQDHELDGDSRYVYPIFYSLLTDLQNL